MLSKQNKTSFTYRQERDALAFTISELLVVIVIVGILIGLVIPVAGKMRTKSEAARCVAAMRNIMIAEALYSNDNDNHLVPYQIWLGATAQAGYRYWSWLLHPYITQKPDAVFSAGNGDGWWMRCPSQKNRDAQGRVLPGIGPVFGSGNPHYLHGAPTVSNPVARPSQKRILITEASKTPSWMDVQGATLDGAYPAYCRGCYPNGGISNASLGITDGNNLTDRHSGGSNVGFVDGHIEWVTIERLRAAPVPNGVDFWKHYESY